MTANTTNVELTTFRLLRTYAPLLVLGLGLVLMAVLAPTIPETTTTEISAGNPTAADNRQVTTDADGTATDAGSAQTGSAAATSGGTQRSGQASTGGTQVAQPTQPGTTGGCADRVQQVPGDPYSPPCVAFSGNNGGATATGVTPTEIVIGFRKLDEPGFQDALASIAGADISDTPEDLIRTSEALAEYFNTRFQFYGRNIRFEVYEGKGSTTNELLGGGQEEAEADAIHAADLGVFAEYNGSTPPFVDALTRRGIIGMGAPYMSREWYTARRPYAWSLTTDCSIIVETVSEYIHKRMWDDPALHAGGSLQGKPRKFVALAPENPWYQECVEAGQKILESYGRGRTERRAYKLDLSAMSNQASNIIAKFKDTGITTVLCGCDPVMPIFLTSKAEEQAYEPEWFVAGTALTDLDIVGQLYDQEQWSRAAGVSFLGAQQPTRASFGYNAYKQVRDDEPAFSVDLLYYNLYMLAIGIQGAGPNLTPETFEQGMFAYPGGTGPAGTWGFGPQNYTPTEDAREIYWSPHTRSVMNGEEGAYIETEPGVRYRQGQWPTGTPQVFQ